MKKLLALLLVLAMTLSVVACSKSNSEPADAENKTEQSAKEDKAENTPADDESEPSEENEEAHAEGENKQPEAEQPEKAPEKAPDTSKEPEKAPEKEPEKAPDTVGTKLLAEFKSKAGSNSAYDIANSIANGGSLPFMAGAMEVEPGLLSGFDNYEVKGFKSGATFGPMMGSIAFIGYIFELEDGVSASDFISNLKSNANLRWNICVEAEEMVTGSSGNKVFFVMCPKSFEE